MNRTTATIFVATLAVGLIGSTFALSQDIMAQGGIGQNTIKSEPPTFDTPDIQRMTEIVRQLHDEATTESERAELIEEAQQIKRSHEQRFDSTARQAMLDKKDVIVEYISGNLNLKSFDDFTSEFPVSGLYVDSATNKLVVNVFPDEFDSNAESVLQKVRELVGRDIDITVQPMPAITP